jgi:hypothetical protein
VPLLTAPTATLIGPIPYLSITNSPFYEGITNGTVFLETFESGALSVPGVLILRGYVSKDEPDVDSVDADDGRIDGDGSRGHSFFGSGRIPLAYFAFDTNVLGRYPTKVGIVWTDGDASPTRSHVSFRAFSPIEGEGGSISAELGDADRAGGTGEDRFFGIISSNGIESFTLSGSPGSFFMESDHLQFGDFDATLRPALSIRPGADPELSWYARMNVTYQLQGTSDLLVGSWSNLGPPIQGVGSNSRVTLNPRVQPQQFYRVLVRP